MAHPLPGAARAPAARPVACARAPSAPRVALRARRAIARAQAMALSDCARVGEAIRGDFPVLHQEVHGKPLVYLDNAATSQKPVAVLEALDEYYRRYNSNVHRGVHALSACATAAYEEAREKVARFVNASSSQEIVFTRNASEAINLVANTWAVDNLGPGDEIVFSVAEHHSNIVPWQMVAQKTGAVLRPIGLTKDEEIDLDELARVVGPRTKLVAISHVSNTLGFITPIQRVAEIAHAAGAKLLVDACQSVPNGPVDVQTLGADWIVASGHKMCGPTGIGFLWGSLELLESMPPWMGGGEMIQEVQLLQTTYAEPPLRFEAGTPAIAQAIGLGFACDYLSELGMANVRAYEEELAGLLYEEVARVPGVRIYGPPPSAGRAALVGFNVQGVHATDLSTILDYSGYASRSGHMCTQPLLRSLGTEACIRASAYVYTTPAEVEGFAAALRDAISFLS